MIKIKLNECQNAYDIVSAYIKKYWGKHYYTDVIIHIATSRNDNNYDEFNEYVAFDGYGNMEYQHDWWEGEQYIKIYGIIDIDKIRVPDNISG